MVCTYIPGTLLHPLTLIESDERCPPDSGEITGSDSEVIPTTEKFFSFIVTQLSSLTFIM